MAADCLKRRARAPLLPGMLLALLHRQALGAPRLKPLYREDALRLPEEGDGGQPRSAAPRGQPAVPLPALYRPEPPPASLEHKYRHAGSLSSLFPPLSDAWSAPDLIAHWERLRAAAPRVPFYLYEDPWGRVDAGKTIGRYRRCKAARTNQYGSDVHFLAQLERHPWRVRRPSSARFLIPPVALGMASREFCRMRESAAQVMAYVQASPLWVTRRQDHLFVALHWKVRPSHVPGVPVSAWVGYRTGKYGEGGRRVPRTMAPYNDAADMPPFRPDGARNVSFFFGGRTLALSNHPGYRVRDLFREKSRTLYTTPGLPMNNVFVDVSMADKGMPVCRDEELAVATKAVCRGRYAEGPLMRRSRFTVNVRGDQPGTNRLERCVEHGSVCVAVSDRVYYAGEPFQCLVPYEHMVAEVGEVAFACNPGRALLHVLREWPLSRRRRARLLMAHFARDLLWRTKGSRVAENVLLEAAATYEPSPEAPAVGPIPCGFRNRLVTAAAYDNATNEWLKTTRAVSNRKWPCPKA